MTVILRETFREAVSRPEPRVGRERNHHIGILLEKPHGRCPEHPPLPNGPFWGTERRRGASTHMIFHSGRHPGHRVKLPNGSMGETEKRREGAFSRTLNIPLNHVHSFYTHLSVGNGENHLPHEHTQSPAMAVTPGTVSGAVRSASLCR
uniref:Uncharacterized protein n=1 Tax=Molossus molossus TaxID=27622 RepID=A0A7J8I0V5_MOLMO|nr:hypothetical protein HJG59_010804 [Molossus molossus]